MAFVAPIFSKASRLTLAMQEAEVFEDCYTQQGLTLAVRAVIAFKVGDDRESIAAAARRFQGDQGQMPTLVGRIFSGHLRSIIGSMTVEAIIREQQTLADAIVDASKSEMARIGLAVDSLQISSIDDKGVGYIKALAAPHQARVNQEAKIAQAAADRASAMAQQERACATRPSTPARPRSRRPGTRPRSTRPNRRRRRPGRSPSRGPSRRYWSRSRWWRRTRSRARPSSSRR